MSNYTLIIWGQQTPNPDGFDVSFDVQYQEAGGDWTDVVVDQAPGAVGNAGGNVLPTGAYVPPEGGACWSPSVATEFKMRVRTKFTQGAEVLISEWVEWLGPR